MVLGAGALARAKKKATLTQKVAYFNVYSFVRGVFTQPLGALPIHFSTRALE